MAVVASVTLSVCVHPKMTLAINNTKFGTHRHDLQVKRLKVELTGL